jgi:Ca2+-binding RTX toxin-like protein
VGSETKIADQVQTPDVVALSDGGFLVTWNGYGADGNGYAVLSRRFDSDGVPSGDAFLVNLTTENDQMLPAAAGLPDGSFVITWFGHGPGDVMTGEVVASGVNLFEGYDGNLGGGVFMRLFRKPSVEATAIVSGDSTDNLLSWASDTAMSLQGNGGNDTLRGGVGFDSLDGGTGDDELQGAAGSDTLSGGEGADLMRGGAGDDTYIVDNILDAVFETVSAANPADSGGMDTVRASVSHALKGNVENLVLEGTRAINAVGNALANVLTGNAGNNVLDGGAGADTMRGGAGDDSYRVAVAGDVVVEADGAGVDTVRASVSYTLTTNVESLILEGAGPLAGTGNALANTLTGNAGNNVLDGGAGADIMRGGAGDDSYRVSDNGDVVTEALGAGVDTVRASVSYTLAGNVENLVLDGTAPLMGTGNAAANLITGNAGDNVLDGGIGADTMRGGAGDDNYRVGAAGDVVIEATDAGMDTVSSSLNYTLTSNVENLVLEGTALRGTGNLAANTITGNTLGNTLTGRAGDDLLFGGQGADTLAGGEGQDRIHLGNDADVDVFVFRALTDSVTGDLRDLVYDFQSGEDRLDLHLIDANRSIIGNQAFAFAEGPAANAVWAAGDSNTTVFGDINGDAIPDFEFQLVGVTTVAATDFVL